MSVYCAIPIEPIAKTIQNVMLLQPCPEKPELLTVSREDVADRLMVVGDDDQRDDDDDDADRRASTPRSRSAAT